MPPSTGNLAAIVGLAAAEHIEFERGYCQAQADGIAARVDRLATLKAIGETDLIAIGEELLDRDTKRLDGMVAYLNYVTHQWLDAAEAIDRAPECFELADPPTGYDPLDIRPISLVESGDWVHIDGDTHMAFADARLNDDGTATIVTGNGEHTAPHTTIVYAVAPF